MKHINVTHLRYRECTTNGETCTRCQWFWRFLLAFLILESIWLSVVQIRNWEHETDTSTRSGQNVNMYERERTFRFQTSSSTQPHHSLWRLESMDTWSKVTKGLLAGEVPTAKKGSQHTSQTPCAVNSFTKSGTESEADSFSYLSSSWSRCASETSAVQMQKRIHQYRYQQRPTTKTYVRIFFHKYIENRRRVSNSQLPWLNLLADTENALDTLEPAHAVLCTTRWDRAIDNARCEPREAIERLVEAATVRSERSMLAIVNVKGVG